MASSHRRILPTRRATETFEFSADNIRYVASVGFFPDGAPAEVFVNARKIDTSADVAIGDAAVALSIAFQYGVPMDVIRHAMKRDANGQPRGPLGKLLDIISTRKGEPDAFQVPVPKAPDGGSGTRSEIREEGRCAAESCEGVQQG